MIPAQPPVFQEAIPLSEIQRIRDQEMAHQVMEHQYLADHEIQVRTYSCVQRAFLGIAFGGTLALGGGIWMATHKEIPIALSIVCICLGVLGLGIGLRGYQKVRSQGQVAEQAVLAIQDRLAHQVEGAAIEEPAQEAPEGAALPV